MKFRVFRIGPPPNDYWYWVLNDGVEVVTKGKPLPSRQEAIDAVHLFKRQVAQAEEEVRP